MNCKTCETKISGQGKHELCIHCFNKSRIGERHSEETKAKIAKSHIGIAPWNKSIKTGPLSEEVKKKISENHADVSGSNNGRYIDGRSRFAPLSEAIVGLKEHKIWRTSVFKRDDYICNECHKRGGSLHTHHIKRFAIIFQEFLKQYNQFSPIEDKETLVRLAINYKPFWDIDNGITYCEECHKYEHKRK